MHVGLIHSIPALWYTPSRRLYTAVVCMNEQSILRGLRRFVCRGNMTRKWSIYNSEGLKLDVDVRSPIGLSHPPWR